jgi:hypothetical protein
MICADVTAIHHFHFSPAAALRLLPPLLRPARS